MLIALDIREFLTSSKGRDRYFRYSKGRKLNVTFEELLLFMYLFIFIYCWRALARQLPILYNSEKKPKSVGCKIDDMRSRLCFLYPGILGCL